MIVSTSQNTNFDSKILMLIFIVQRMGRAVQFGTISGTAKINSISYLKY